MGKLFMKGNEAIAAAAIRAGLRFFAGYPITPSSEILEYLPLHLPDSGGIFIQAASEIEAIHMVYGATAAGARAMTASSSPGMSLKMEGISFLACAQLPCVIVDIMRGGPGLGGIQPAQSDYFQIVKGGGHGDYRLIVLAPSTVQEAADFTFLAFDLADKYRNPVVLLGDGVLGQIMEQVVFPENYKPISVDKSWTLTGAKGREPNKITPFTLDDYELEQINLSLQAKYHLIERQEARYEMSCVGTRDEYGPSVSKTVIVAYGTCGRIAKTVIDLARQENIDVKLFRPITLWPFPYKELRSIAEINPTARFLVVEMSAGQMVEDVRLAISNDKRVNFYGRMGGIVPTPEEILEEIKKLRDGVKYD